MDINAKTIKLRAMSSALKKRSISIHAHRTSIALESAFWDVIDTEVKARGSTFAGFLMQLDDERHETAYAGNLASYLRVWVVVHLQAKQSQ